MHATRYIHYIYIVAIAFLLQGCHRESHPNNPDAESYAISMAPTSVQGASRALINGIDDLQNLNLGFVVYGHSTAGDNKQQVFDGDNVTYDTGEGAWGYADEDTELRYWNAAADYCFGAYAPQMDEDDVTENNANGITSSITIKNLPQWQQIDGSETDLIVATSQGTAESYLRDGGTVNLAFNHVYAQLEVQVVKDVTLLKDYTLTGLTYSNIPSEDGMASYTLDYTTPASRWDNISTDEANTISVFSGNAEIDNEGTETTYKHLVVPFSSTIKVSLTYTVGGSDIPGGAEVALTLNPGQKTVLTLTISSTNSITPELYIAEWEEENIDDDPKYNW